MNNIINHFENIRKLYGDDAYIQIPNNIFKDLSSSIKSNNGSTNIQQTSFAYSYIVCISLLYKYSHFVDVDNETYIQNNDIKTLLGYSRTTKSIDSVIKKGGVLDSIGLTNTTRDYPVSANYSNDIIEGMKIRDFTTINMVDNTFHNYELIKKIVKNRNYEIKEPLFLFHYDDDVGSLYDYSNTHKVTVTEFINFLSDKRINNIDFSIYSYIKSKCMNLRNNTNTIPLMRIANELGVGKDSFYKHLDNIKKLGLVDVRHKGWRSSINAETNEYKFNPLLFKQVV